VIKGIGDGTNIKRATKQDRGKRNFRRRGRELYGGGSNIPSRPYVGMGQGIVGLDYGPEGCYGGTSGKKGNTDFITVGDYREGYAGSESSLIHQKD